MHVVWGELQVLGRHDGPHDGDAALHKGGKISGYFIQYFTRRAPPNVISYWQVISQEQLSSWKVQHRSPESGDHASAEEIKATDSEIR